MFGITKNYAASGLDATALAAFLAKFKLRLEWDGARILKNDADDFHWAAAFAQMGDQTDDTPCWGFSGSAATAVSAFAYTGRNDGSVVEKTETFAIMMPTTVVTNVYAAADTRLGWWWMAALNEEAGFVLTLAAGVSSRRYPADTHTGLVARYGIVNLCYGPPWPCMAVPYAANASTAERGTNAKLTVFSPLGYRSAKRPAGSTLPRMVAPIYPATGHSYDDYTVHAPAVMGELDAMMLATDGYAWAEVAQPGWRVFGDTTTGYFALRSPNIFEIL